MATAVFISAKDRGGAYRDVLEFLEDMRGIHGSKANAASILLRKTREYRRWAKQRDPAVKAEAFKAAS